MLLLCQILDICNYEVLCDLIYQKWSLDNVIKVHKIMVQKQFISPLNDLFYLFYFLKFFLQNKNSCLRVT